MLYYVGTSWSPARLLFPYKYEPIPPNITVSVKGPLWIRFHSARTHFLSVIHAVSTNTHLCTPAHCVQMNVPWLVLAHVGSGSWQSAHKSLPLSFSSWASLSRGVLQLPAILSSDKALYKLQPTLQFWFHIDWSVNYVKNITCHASHRSIVHCSSSGHVQTWALEAVLLVEPSLQKQSRAYLKKTTNLKSFLPKVFPPSVF